MKPPARDATLRSVSAATLALALAGCGAGHAGTGAAATGAGQIAGATGHLPASGCARQIGFDLSLARDRGGQPTPVAAADWFAGHGGVAGIPRRGWRLAHRSGRDATLASGRTVLRAVQGSDGTWQVDGGETCRSS